MLRLVTSRLFHGGRTFSTFKNWSRPETKELEGLCFNYSLDIDLTIERIRSYMQSDCDIKFLEAKADFLAYEARILKVKVDEARDMAVYEFKARIETNKRYLESCEKIDDENIPKEEWVRVWEHRANHWDSLAECERKKRT